MGFNKTASKTGGEEEIGGAIRMATRFHLDHNKDHLHRAFTRR
jgi:hypothetical protein